MSAVDEVAVRPAGAADVARLALWNAQLIRDERNDNAGSGGDLQSRLREWLAADYGASVFEAGGVPFGYALFRVLPECVHLRHFYVEPGFRRRGYGRRAFECMRDAFPRDRRILVEVLVWNAAGAAFWKRVGFEERYLGLQMPAAGP